MPAKEVKEVVENTAEVAAESLVESAPVAIDARANTVGKVAIGLGVGAAVVAIGLFVKKQFDKKKAEKEAELQEPEKTDIVETNDPEQVEAEA